MVLGRQHQHRSITVQDKVMAIKVASGPWQACMRECQRSAAVDVRMRAAPEKEAELVLQRANGAKACADAQSIGALLRVGGAEKQGFPSSRLVLRSMKPCVGALFSQRSSRC